MTETKLPSCQLPEPLHCRPASDSPTHGMSSLTSPYLELVSRPPLMKLRKATDPKSPSRIAPVLITSHCTSETYRDTHSTHPPSCLITKAKKPRRRSPRGTASLIPSVERRRRCCMCQIPLPTVLLLYLTCLCSKEDLGKARVVALDAAKSQAYLYPIKVPKISLPPRPWENYAYRNRRASSTSSRIARFGGRFCPA